MEFFIADAMRRRPRAAAGAGVFFDILPIIFLFVVFYFVMVRPQTKRNKEQKKMMEALAKGDEIVTTGGMLGRVLEVGENFVLIDVGKAVEVKVQKAQVATTVPKGTVKTPLGKRDRPRAMNRYPLWKNLLILSIIVLGVLYALPNLYGEYPALQISTTRSAPLDKALEDKVRAALKEARLEPLASSAMRAACWCVSPIPRRSSRPMMPWRRRSGRSMWSP